MSSLQLDQLNLSIEQRQFIDLALSGKNILVDACIGSGKTTSIQYLCNQIDSSKKVLYLTFNKLLKLEAKEKIKNYNVTVTNYHGFVYPYLLRAGIRTSIERSIQEFVANDIKINHFDVLIIDEYQDINDVTSKLLEKIKAQNPSIQIIAVGDMKQKLYDNTILDVSNWIKLFLDDYIKVNFTNCFRLNSEHATKLGNAWNKQIIGVNNNQTISMMNFNDAIEYLATLEPQDVLVLGQNKGLRTEALDILQRRYFDKFNKYTVYNTTQERASNIEPSELTYIFTTFDSSKGLERKYCFVFDYNETYLELRKSMPNANHDIIDNLFLVAASRGKDEIIFVNRDQEITKFLQNKSNPKNSVGFIDISKFGQEAEFQKKLSTLNPSTMFDFKFDEHIEACREMLLLEEIQLDDTSEIDINTTDEKLDLSSAISLYASGQFFKDLNVEEIIKFYASVNDMRQDKLFMYIKSLKWQLGVQDGGYYEFLQSRPDDFDIPYIAGKYETTFHHDKRDLQWELICLLSVMTGDDRYIREVQNRYVNDQQSRQLKDRMSSLLKEDDLHNITSYLKERSDSNQSLTFMGQVDVVKDEELYTIKFSSAISNTHLLECAMNMLMMKKEIGYVWNLRTNELIKVRISDKIEFLNRVVKCVTKGTRSEWSD